MTNSLAAIHAALNQIRIALAAIQAQLAALESGLPNAPDKYGP